MRGRALRRGPRVDLYRLGGRVVAGLAVLVSILMVVPAFFTIPVSFSATRYIIFPPKTLSLRWYEAYFTIPEWTGATGYSVLLATLTMLATLALGLPAAFGLARGTFRGRKAMILLFVVPLMIPVILIAMAEYFFLNDLGLIGTTTGLVIAHTVFAIPFVIIIVYATLQGFDRRYELAAMSLGASPRRHLLARDPPAHPPRGAQCRPARLPCLLQRVPDLALRHRQRRLDPSHPVLEGHSLRIEPDHRRRLLALHRAQHRHAAPAPRRTPADRAPLTRDLHPGSREKLPRDPEHDALLAVDSPLPGPGRTGIHARRRDMAHSTRARAVGSETVQAKLEGAAANDRSALITHRPLLLGHHLPELAAGEPRSGPARNDCSGRHPLRVHRFDHRPAPRPGRDPTALDRNQLAMARTRSRRRGQRERRQRGALPGGRGGGRRRRRAHPFAATRAHHRGDPLLHGRHRAGAAPFP